MFSRACTCSRPPFDAQTHDEKRTHRGQRDDRPRMAFYECGHLFGPFHGSGLFAGLPVAVRKRRRLLTGLSLFGPFNFRQSALRQDDALRRRRMKIELGIFTEGDLCGGVVIECRVALIGETAEINMAFSAFDAPNARARAAILAEEMPTKPRAQPRRQPAANDDDEDF